MAQKEYVPKIEYIKTNRNHEAILIDNKYIFNFSRIQANQSKIYRCSYYKKSTKCTTFIKIKLDQIMEKYESNHNHNIKETAGVKARAKSEIKDKLANLKKSF